MRMEFQLVPTIQMDIELLPAMNLACYVSEILKMHPSERVRDRLIKSLKGWEFALRSEKRRVMLNKESFENDIILRQIAPNYDADRELTVCEKKDYLKRVFINSYYTLNFISPELGLEDELRNTRERFLEVVSREPYFLVNDGAPIGLNLYHRHPTEGPSEYEDYVVPADVGLTKLISQPAEPAYGDSAFHRQVNTLALQALRESISREKRNELSSQLKLLIAGYINPKMFGVSLEEYLEKAVPEVYKDQADNNGDFEMPLPRCLV